MSDKHEITLICEKRSHQTSETVSAVEKICKKVVSYKQDEELTTEEIAQKVQLSKAEAEDILYYRIDYFTLDRLVFYASKLFSPLKVRMAIEVKKISKDAHASVL